MSGGKEYWAGVEEGRTWTVETSQGEAIKETILKMSAHDVYTKFTELVKKLDLIDNLALTRQQYERLNSVRDALRS